ncbi:hypothetical protein [Paenibacillus lautus]
MLGQNGVGKTTIMKMITNLMMSLVNMIAV